MNERLYSIFREYYADKPFIDRYLTEAKDAVDVIIPVIHTNELWKANLLSFYREIPIHKLLIGDGGCIDDSISIAEKFPRVQIFDHRSFKSLGYSIRKLIEAVETDWFIYLHSDVYLPVGWYEAMQRYQGQYDWFECRHQATLLVEYPLDYTNVQRPLSGSQVGRKAAFEGVLPSIDDDFLYRNEDIILAELVQRAGFRYGRVDEVFHYHQTMHKPTPWARKVKAVKIDVELSREEDVRTCMMQGKGIVKYLQPHSNWLIRQVVQSFNRLTELKQITWRDCKQWVMETNPVWWPYVRLGIILGRIPRCLKSLLIKIYKSFTS
jgi:hypothetical protein